MPLRFYNTKTRQVEDFMRDQSTPVTMYNCGPTVYGYAHIGNLRAYVMADLIRRTLEWNGYGVKQIINITDVGHLVSDADEGEDKMSVAAEREGKSATEIAQFYTNAFMRDLALLNVETDGVNFPKATDHIAEQIDLIKRLEEKGFAYKISDGVYFDTAKLGDDYGKLLGGRGKLNWDEEFARVTPVKEKRNHLDFALWKFSQSSDKRLQEWDSPWGRGFPGWHIECSAMSMKYLGETIDIHTGGIDHIPVHHTNEIAQSEAATGHEFVKLWMHSAFMTVDGQKMSKSLGNTLTLADLKKNGIHPMAFRYWLFTGHYRTTLNFTYEAARGAQAALAKIADFLWEHDETGSVLEIYRAKFSEAINNDLNLPEALAVVWSLLKDDAVSSADKRATLLEMDKVLGLGFATIQKIIIPDEIQKLANDREEARKAKDFKKSDELRDEAAKLGWEIQDTPQGPKIKRL